MKSILAHHRALKIKEKDLNLYGFRKVNEAESVIQAANSVRDNFMPHYFNGWF